MTYLTIHKMTGNPDELSERKRAQSLFEHHEAVSEVLEPQSRNERSRHGEPAPDRRRDRCPELTDL